MNDKDIKKVVKVYKAFRRLSKAHTDASVEGWDIAMLGGDSYLFNTETCVWVCDVCLEADTSTGFVKLAVHDYDINYHHTQQVLNVKHLKKMLKAMP